MNIFPVNTLDRLVVTFVQLANAMQEGIAKQHYVYHAKQANHLLSAFGNAAGVCVGMGMDTRHFTAAVAAILFSHRQAQTKLLFVCAYVPACIVSL